MLRNEEDFILEIRLSRRLTIDELRQNGFEEHVYKLFRAISDRCISPKDNLKLFKDEKDYGNKILVEILNQHDFMPRKFCRSRENLVVSLCIREAETSRIRMYCALSNISSVV